MDMMAEVQTPTDELVAVGVPKVCSLVTDSLASFPYNGSLLPPSRGTVALGPWDFLIVVYGVRGCDHNLKISPPCPIPPRKCSLITLPSRTVSL